MSLALDISGTRISTSVNPGSLKIIFDFEPQRDTISLAKAMGGKIETLCGLSGVGDMVLTCMGGFSRNVKTGILIGRGKDLPSILNETGMIPEGANTVKSAQQLSEKYNVDMPLIKNIYNVLFDGMDIKAFLNELI